MGHKNALVKHFYMALLLIIYVPSMEGAVGSEIYPVFLLEEKQQDKNKKQLIVTNTYNPLIKVIFEQNDQEQVVSRTIKFEVQDKEISVQKNYIALSCTGGKVYQYVQEVIGNRLVILDSQTAKKGFEHLQGLPNILKKFIQSTDEYIFGRINNQFLMRFNNWLYSTLYITYIAIPFLKVFNINEDALMELRGLYADAMDETKSQYVVKLALGSSHSLYLFNSNIISNVTSFLYGKNKINALINAFKAEKRSLRSLVETSEYASLPERKPKLPMLLVSAQPTQIQSKSEQLSAISKISRTMEEEVAEPSTQVTGTSSVPSAQKKQSLGLKDKEQEIIYEDDQGVPITKEHIKFDEKGKPIGRSWLTPGQRKGLLVFILGATAYFTAKAVWGMYKPLIYQQWSNLTRFGAQLFRR